jgi:hypothetical protein
MKTIVEDLVSMVAGSRRSPERKDRQQNRAASPAASPANKRMAKAPQQQPVKVNHEEIIPMAEEDFKDF